MAQVTVRCVGELNDFLPRDQRGSEIVALCAGHESVKNLIESLGVPHPEIAALSVNDRPVGFTYTVQPGDQIVAYPVSARLDFEPVPLRPAPRDHRFVLDTHLGRLAAYLRMLGFDTLYRNDYDDPELARIAAEEQRILLTRDVGLLKRSIVTYGYFVRSIMPVHQLGEVVQRYHLSGATASFQRCIRCNGLTVPVAKSLIDHLLEPKTRRYYNEFHRCEQCSQIYWRGSHFVRMQQLVADVLGGASAPEQAP